jgi:hypothetical protein
LGFSKVCASSVTLWKASSGSCYVTARHIAAAGGKNASNATAQPFVERRIAPPFTLQRFKHGARSVLGTRST